MNRRRVLAALPAASVAVAGCLTGDGPDDAETDGSGEEGDSCPERTELRASLPGSVPEDVAVADAETDGYTENEHVAELLERAKRAYEDRTEIELESDESKRLARISREDIDVGASLDGDGTYVEYEGVTYRLSRRWVVC